MHCSFTRKLTAVVLLVCTIFMLFAFTQSAQAAACDVQVIYTPDPSFEPWLVATDDAGNTYVVDECDVRKYSPDGSLIWISEKVEYGDFSGRRHLAVDSQGRVYLSYWGFVHRYAADGSIDTSWIPVDALMTGDAAHRLDKNNDAIAVDNADRLILMDSYGAAVTNVERYDTNGNYIDQPIHENFWSQDMALGADDSIYIYKEHAGEIIKYNADGNPAVWGPLSTSTDISSRLMLDSAGRVYVCDWQNDELLRYQADGSVDAAWAGDGVLNASDGVLFDFDDLVCLAVTNSDRVLLCDSNKHRIVDVGLDPLDGSASEMVFGLFGTGAGKFSEYLMDIMRCPSGGYYTLEMQGELEKYTSPGVLDTLFGAGGMVALAGYAYDMAMDTDGSLYIASRSPNGVAKYTPSGELDTSWGSGGWLTLPEGCSAVEVDGKGRLLTFQLTDTAVERWLSDGSKDTSFGMSGRLSVLTASDSYVFDLMVDADGSLLIPVMVNFYTGYILKYTSAMVPDVSFGADGQVDWSDLGFIIVPYGLDQDNRGRILVTHQGDSQFDSKVIRLLTDGSLDTSFSVDGMWSGTPDRLTQLDDPFDLYVDGDCILIADQDNCRVVMLDVLSDDAALASLSLSAGTLNPVFDPKTLNYTASVPNETDSVTVAVDARHGGATVTRDTGAQSLHVGENTLTVTVTAEDGITVRNYTVTITRALSGLLPPTPSVSPAPTSSQDEDVLFDFEGVLLDKDGNPLVGWTVKLESTPRTTVTNADGRYVFENVKPEKHKLTLQDTNGTVVAVFDMTVSKQDSFDWWSSGTDIDIDVTNATALIDIEIVIQEDGDVVVEEVTQHIANPDTGNGSVVWMVLAAMTAMLAVVLVVMIRRIHATALK